MSLTIFAKIKIMKKLFTILIAILFANFSFAQEDEYKTLFGNSDGKTSVSGFGAVTLDFGSADGNFSLMMGGDIAAIFNRSFYIGLYGRGLTTMPNYKYLRYSAILGQNIPVEERAMFGHGGLIVGVVLSPTSPVHVGFSGKFGMGGIGMIDDYYYGTPSQPTEFLSVKPLYILTPQIDLEMNLTEWFKFRVSGGYQFVSSESLNYLQMGDSGIMEKELLNSKDFSTPYFSLGFVFGWFK